MTSYAVSRQTQEIGLRMALGAGQDEVVRGVVKQGMRPVVMGLAVGLVTACAGAALVRSLLFGVGALDPIAFGGAIAVLRSAAVAACYVPARHAAQLDPVGALRAEWNRRPHAGHRFIVVIGKTAVIGTYLAST